VSLALLEILNAKACSRPPAPNSKTFIKIRFTWQK
jgi:hypothetical protein